jgi:Transposase DDE domain
VIPATEPAREALHGPVSADPSSRLDYERHHEWDIENFFAKLKQFRAVATRYDKTARNFLAAVYLAAIAILLN